ncbi:hypothetical protein V1286_004016 [Bradyrhizobium algeriense]|uniref:Uncharacterized protein n=1 Tax=Bradyrhizobium algeriense TaxID=634784 RepID=A0ABU8BD70_9BRAD
MAAETCGYVGRGGEARQLKSEKEWVEAARRGEWSTAK